MDGIILIIIVVIILFIVYKLIKNEPLKNDNDYNDIYDDNYNYIDDMYTTNSHNVNNSEIIDKVQTNLITKFNSNEPLHSHGNLKPYFVETQFHNDYRDTLTAFNNVAPSQKLIFNRSNLPVTQSNVDPIQTKPLVKQFIKQVNKNIKYVVTDFLTSQSGWDESLERNVGQSGWQKAMKELNIPDNLYKKSALRSKIKLLKIDRVEKYVTTDQIRFIVFMIVQKINVDDQMIVKVSFVMNNVDINKNRTFNDKYAKEDLNIQIEEIFVVGYLTDHSYGSTSNRTNFYEFENIESNNFIDQNEIIKQLQQKYKQREIDGNGLTVQISPNDVNDLAIKRIGMYIPYDNDGCK
jgi:hypothetical protein